MPAFLFAPLVSILFLLAILFAIHYGHDVARFINPHARDLVVGLVLDVVELLHVVAAERSARYVLIIFSFLLLLIFSRANAVFVYLTDKVRVGLDNAEFTHLQNAIMQIASVASEVFVYGVAMRWLDQAVSGLFFLVP